jgi:hypothetical protein
LVCFETTLLLNDDARFRRICDRFPDEGLLVDKPRRTCLKEARSILDYGFSLHHFGHLTLWGVRVAFTTTR